MKAIVSDLDGTLLDRDASLQEFINAQHKRFEALGHIPAHTYLSRFVELDCRGAVWKDKVYQQLVDEYSISSVSWQDLLADYKNRFANSCIAFPHLHVMLETLQKQNYKLGIITNGRAEFQMHVIQALGIEHFFDVILISEAEGIRKSEYQIFHRAITRLNSKAEESIFIGDHPEADITGAKNAGMKTIWKQDFYWPIPEKADAVVDDLDQIPAIVETM